MDIFNKSFALKLLKAYLRGHLSVEDVTEKLNLKVKDHNDNGILTKEVFSLESDIKNKDRRIRELSKYEHRNKKLLIEIQKLTAIIDGINNLKTDK